MVLFLHLLVHLQKDTVVEVNGWPKVGIHLRLISKAILRCTGVHLLLLVERSKVRDSIRRSEDRTMVKVKVRFDVPRPMDQITVKRKVILHFDS